VIQVVNLLISMAIYYPFFRAWDKQKYREENQAAASAPSAAVGEQSLTP